MRQQYAIKDYFVRGRHKKYILFIWHNLTQKLIGSWLGGNINFLCLFKQDHKYMKDLYDEYVGSDFTFEEFNLLEPEFYI
jgi:hypothetical protein